MRVRIAFSIAVICFAIHIGTANAQLAPSFGGVPADHNIGIGIRGGGISGNLTLNLGQTSNRSINSSSASVTTMDGVPGYIYNTVTRPFVTGYIPIVGSYARAQPFDHQAVFDRQNQQAWDRAHQSQANIRNRSLQKYLSRADRAEKEGDKKMARANFRRAIRLADEPLRSELKTRMQQMLQE